MKTLLFSSMFLFFSIHHVCSQVDVDKPINLSGGTGERIITNLEQPANDNDAANKKYVDDQIAANSGGSGRALGELAEGGVVYQVYKDASGDEHGLVISHVENSAGTAWSNVTSSFINTTNVWDGASNTSAIIGQSGHTSSAAKLCDDYAGGGYTDWYLPSITQLITVWSNLYAVQQTLAAAGGADLMAVSPSAYYWSSTEDNGGNARRHGFYYGNIEFGGTKSDSNRVRCIRNF